MITIYSKGLRNFGYQEINIRESLIKLNLGIKTFEDFLHEKGFCRLCRTPFGEPGEQ